MSHAKVEKENHNHFLHETQKLISLCHSVLHSFLSYFQIFFRWEFLLYWYMKKWVKLWYVNQNQETPFSFSWILLALSHPFLLYEPEEDKKQINLSESFLRKTDQILWNVALDIKWLGKNIRNWMISKTRITQDNKLQNKLNEEKSRTCSAIRVLMS